MLLGEGGGEGVLGFDSGFLSEIENFPIPVLKKKCTKYIMYIFPFQIQYLWELKIISLNFFVSLSYFETENMEEEIYERGDFLGFFP
jgi:hypothetical protein